MPTRIQIRRGTAAEWTAASTTLAAGELGFETDTGRMKCGDGATAWAAVPYFGSSVTSSQISDSTSIGRAVLTAANAGAARTAIGAGDALTAGHLGQFAATTSAQLAATLSDKTGFSTGAVAVFSIAPSLTGVTTFNQAGGTNAATLTVNSTQTVLGSVNSTSVILQAGGQSCSISNNGQFFTAGNILCGSSGGATLFGSVGMVSTGTVRWGNSGTPAIGYDTSLARAGVSQLKVTNASTGLGSLWCGSAAVGDVGLRIQAISGQTAPSTQWLASDGTTVVANVSAGGSLTLGSATTTASLTVYTASNSGLVVTNVSGTTVMRGHNGAAFQIGSSNGVSNDNVANLYMRTTALVSWGGDVGAIRQGAGIAKITDGSTGTGSLRFKPVSQSNATADNGELYYSTDAGKLVYKDSGGVVNNLY